MTHSENYFDLRNHNNRRFPVILYNLIESSDPSIISWTTSGDAFQIHNSEFLVRFVVPYFFQHNNFSSLQRQLNTYGFKLSGNKWKHGHGAYFHPHFKRGRVDLLDRIVRHMGVRSRKGVNSYNSVSKNLTGSNCDQLESEAHAADDDFQSNRYSTDLSDEIESPQYLPLDFKSPSQAYLAHQYSFQSYSQSRMQLQTPIFTGINGNIRANENTFVRSQTDLYPSMSSASSTCSTYRQLCPPSTIQHSLNNLKALIANADSPIAISKCSQDSIRTEEVLLEEDIFASPEAFYSYVSKHSESESTT